jgi:thiol-disulfide isomerase/thioredoxin
MKQLSIFLLFLVSASIHAQTPQQSIPLAIEDPAMDAYLSSRKLPELTIKVINRPASEKKVDISYVLVTFGSSAQIKKNAQANDNGEVKILLEQNLPYQQIWLSVDTFLYAGVYVNTDLTVTVDVSKLKAEAYMIEDGINYSGTDGEFNTVMNEHVIFRQKHITDPSSRLFDLARKRLMASSKSSEVESQFLTAADSIYQKLLKIDRDFADKFPNYAWAFKNETHSEFYRFIFDAYLVGGIPNEMEEKVLAHKPLFTSNAGVDFYNSLTRYATSMAYQKEGLSFQELNKYRDNRSLYEQAILDSIIHFEKMDNSRTTEDNLIFSSLTDKGYQLFSKELQLIFLEKNMKVLGENPSIGRADIFRLSLLASTKDFYESAYPTILNSTKTSWCRRLIQNELIFATAKQKEMDILLASASKIDSSDIFIGKPLLKLPFGADLYRLDSIMTVDDFVVSLKSKFKNKALIIDFWATWCGPCISDMPYSKKLHEENSDLPIEYIYLCTTSQSNEKLWKKRIIDAKIPGTHIFIDDKLVTELQNKFDTVRGFPAYVLVDINGRSNSKSIKFMNSINIEGIKQLAGL